MKAFGNLADRLAGLLLGEREAGACVPFVGEFCYCRNGKRYVHSCAGPCEWQGNFC